MERWGQWQDEQVRLIEAYLDDRQKTIVKHWLVRDSGIDPSDANLDYTGEV